MPAPSDFVANATHGEIKVSDGTAVTPLVWTADNDNGDLSVSGITESGRELVKYFRRGLLHAVALGDPVIPTGSFTLMMSEHTGGAGAGNGTLKDLIKGVTGTEFEDRVGTLGATHPVKTFNVTWTFTDYDDTDHVLVLGDVHFTADLADGSPNVESWQFEVLGDITFDGVAYVTR